jgi:DNA-binding transcriptional ArsR family regulator
VSEAADEEEDALLELLDDEYARAILTATSAEPMSANELSEAIDASVTTVYRRVDRLKDHGLIEEQLRPQPDGNHYKVFAGTLSRVEVSFDDGEMELAVETVPEEDPADRFTRMWEDL